MSLLYTGVNLSGLEFGNGDRVWVDYAVPGREEYDYWSQNVGANVVRLPFTWERLQPTAGGDFDQEYLSYLKDSVGYAKANGMTIILDMHNYARYDGQVTDAAKLSDAWKKLGAEFGGDDSVWFNLMNEPYDIAATKWANITQQVVNDLRAEGIDNKLLLSGTAWSGAHSWVSSGNASAYEGFRDPMNNFAFDVHQYLDGDSSGTSGNTVAGSGSERLVKITEWAESNGFKLFLGEAGVADDSRSIKENGDMLNYMESHGETWIGFSLWGAGPWWGDYYFEINPQGSEHDPAVQALMKHIQNSSAPEVRSEPVPESQPDPVSAPVQTSDVGNSDSGVLFKGVNLAGLEFGKGGTHGKDYICPGKGEYEYWAQDVGSNVVRLPFTWERLQPSAYGELDGEYLGYLKNSVAWAKANGMTIALDMHNYARYDGQITDAGKLSDVWKKLGDVFGGDDSVWFNLMNEPYDVSATKWAGITQQVVDDLRADGIDNKLLLSGTAWSGAHSWVSSGNAAAYENFHDPLNNFAFDVHQYLDGDSSGTSGSSVSGAGSTRLVKITEWAEANGFKLFLGEAGVADDSQSIKEMGDMLQYMEDHSGAWLGWSLWGAGPWWGNYYFEINPQGGQHDPAIDALMKFMKPGQAAPEPSPEPNPEPQPNPAPSPEPTPTEPSTGIQANNMKGNTAIDGTTGNDTVHTWAGQMDAGDRIQLGEGFDTLVFRNTGLKFDSAVYKGLSGIDHLDMTASTGKAFVVLDEAFLRSTDDGAIKITFGSAGLGGLDASRLADGSYSVEWKSGSVTVVLGDAPAPAPQPSPAPGKSTPDTDLGPAPDPVDVVKPTPTAYEDVAGIRANVYSGARTVDGTDGNDTVYAFNGQIDAGDVIRLGSGHDTFFSLSSRADIDTASMPGYSGVDEFDLSGTARAGYVTLTEGFLANTDHGEVTVNVGDKGLRLLDTSALDHASTDVFLYGDGDVFLSDGDDEVALIRGSQATLHGGGGNDALYGDTADDVLYGDGGMDFLYGDDGNDILVGGAGADLLNGGGGHDVFQYLDIADAGDVLQGFEAGDQLDLLNLLAANGIGSMDEAFSGGYVTAAQAGANATVSFDADGAAGSAKAVTLATIENFASDDLTFAGMSAA